MGLLHMLKMGQTHGMSSLSGDPSTMQSDTRIAISKIINYLTETMPEVRTAIEESSRETFNHSRLFPLQSSRCNHTYTVSIITGRDPADFQFGPRIPQWTCPANSGLTNGFHVYQSCSYLASNRIDERHSGHRLPRTVSERLRSKVRQILSQADR